MPSYEILLQIQIMCLTATVDLRQLIHILSDRRRKVKAGFLLWVKSIHFLAQTNRPVDLWM